MYCYENPAQTTQPWPVHVLVTMPSASTIKIQPAQGLACGDNPVARQMDTSGVLFKR